MSPQATIGSQGAEKEKLVHEDNKELVHRRVTSCRIAGRAIVVGGFTRKYFVSIIW